MIAILLYLIGLVTLAITLLFAGLEAPSIHATLLAAQGEGTEALLPALAQAAGQLQWALVPFLGGLLLMGFARIIMLLGDIRHALRGPA